MINVNNKLGTFRVALIAAVGFPLMAASAFAQDPTPAPPEGAAGGPATTEATTERIVVTGSNIPTAEEVGPVPVDTYRTEDIQNLGVTTATDLTQKIPAVTGGVVNENISNGGDGRVEINLRGLLPKETLVLVDGRRLAPSLTGGIGGQSVDLNGVPFPLVERIEILKDGASAIYGSDAVAGVFNVYLKKKFRGVEMAIRYGNTNLGSANDAAEKIGHLLAGTGDDKTEIVVFAQWYDRAAIYSADNDISTNAQKKDYNGADTRSGNFAGRVGGFVLRRGIDTPTPHSSANAASNPEYQSRGTLNDPINSDRFAFNFAAFTPAIPAADRQHFYGSITREICEKWLTFYADFKFSRTFFDSALAPTPFVPDPFLNSVGLPNAPAGISVPTQNAFNPFTVGNSTVTINGVAVPVVTGVRYRSLEAGVRTDKFTTYDWYFNAGFRGELGGLGEFFKNWGYEAGFRYHNNYRSELFGNAVSKPGLRDALLDTDPATAFNPFGRNVNTNAAKDRVFVTLHDTSQNTMEIEDGKIYGELFQLPAGPIGFAAGVEHRRERYRNDPDSLNVTFSTIGSTDSTPARNSRDLWSTYGELRIPITSPTWNFPGFYSLELGAAERFEWFSDFGDAQKPKFSLRWNPIDSSLTVRATYNEAFHAPFLNETALSQGETFPQIFDPRGNLGGARIYQARGIVGGNPNLKPENSYGWSYGFVYTPNFIPGKALTVSLDWYHIDLRDQVSPLSFQDIVNREDQLPGFVIRDPGPDNTIVQINNQSFNLGRSVTEGLDYQATYQLDTSIMGMGDFGTFTWTLNGTYLSRYVFAASPGAKEFDITGDYLGFGSLPHHRAYLSLFYDYTLWGGDLHTGATVQYIGDFNDIESNTWPGRGFQKFGRDRDVREWTTLSLLTSYRFVFAPPTVQNDVAGMSKDGGKNMRIDAKDKSVPVSTAEYGCGNWQWWMNDVTISVGINNVFDQAPPFAAAAFENGYDEATHDVKGRFYYVELKKRF